MLLLTIFFKRTFGYFLIFIKFSFTRQFLCVFWLELYKKNNKLGSILSLQLFFQFANLHVLLKNGVNKIFVKFALMYIS